MHGLLFWVSVKVMSRGKQQYIEQCTIRCVDGKYTW